MGSRKCCGTEVTRICLQIFQLFFLITGFVICGIGIWIFYFTYHFINILDSPIYSSTLYIFLATGCLVILNFLIGCCAIPKYQTKLLFCYILLLVMVFLLEGLTGILSYIYRENIEEEVNLNFKTNMLSNYKRDDSKSDSIDYIQQELRCCGSENYLDWRNNTWISNETVPNLVPDSCCKSVLYLCGQRDHPSNIFYRGCSEPLIQEIRIYLWIICAASLGLILYQVIGIILGIVLLLKLEKSKFESKYSPNNNGNENLLKADEAYS